MTYKISNGAYDIDDNGNMMGIDYIEQVLQNAVLMLSARRGKFYPDKNYGSLISKKDCIKSILAYARQALYDLDGVIVENARLENDNIIFDISINGERRVIISNG